MIIRLLIAFAIFFAIYLTIKQFKQATPQKRKKLIWRSIIFTLITVLIVAVITGKAGLVGGIIAAILGALQFAIAKGFRFLPLLNLFRKQNLFGSPTFKTDYLQIKLNLSTGVLSGVILQGPFQGERMETLSTKQQQELADFYQNKDKKSYYLVLAILKKNDQTDNYASQEKTNINNITKADALEILGLEGDPDKKTIIKAHRQLMLKIHPDRGGNDFLAAQVNLAKEVLLKDKVS